MLVGEDSNGCQRLMLFVKINALYDTSGHVILMLSHATHDSIPEIRIIKDSWLADL